MSRPLDARDPGRHGRAAALSRRAFGGLMGSAAAMALLGRGAFAQSGEAAGAGQAGTAPQPDAEGIIRAHGFSELGTLKYPEGFAHFDYVNVDAPKGGELSYAAEGGFDSFNPYARVGRAADRSADHYESLMVPSYDEPDSLYGLVAESLEYPVTQDWVIFNMRPEATFSDGTPITAQDVVFSHELLLEQGLKSYADAVSKRIPKAEALDSHRVKFHFSPDFPRRALISQVAGTPIYSKAWFESSGARLDEPRMEPGVGSGPYILDSYDVGRRVVYRRNPDYWGRDLNVNVGRFNYDTIRIEYFADRNAAFEAFKAGEYTFRQENNSKAWATAYDFPALSQGHVVKMELDNLNVPSSTGFVFNLDRPQFQDIRVREALQLAFNFEWTNQTLQYGLFKQRSSFFQNSDLMAEGLPEGRELELLQALGDALDPKVLTEPAVMAHESDPSSQMDRRNRRRANALLEEAGWSVDAQGRRVDAQGRPLRIEFLSDDPTFDRLVTPYVDNLKTLGIDAAYVRVDDAQFTKRRRDRDFDMIYGGYPSSDTPSTGLYQQFGQEAASYSVFNPTGVSGPDIEPLIDAVVEAKSREEDLNPAARALDRVLRAKRIMVPGWFLDKYWVAFYDMYGIPENRSPYALGYEDLWWIYPEKAEALKAAGVLR